MDRKAGFRKRALSFLLAGSCLAGFASAATPKESVLYQFNGGADGAMPMAGMTADKSGNLFGTTNAGGGAADCASGCGTVFELSPPAQRGDPWTETVIYSFQGGSDGANPQVPMIVDSKGNLYGSTSEGGDGNCGDIGLTGCGTIFELAPPRRAGAPWTERLLYSFQGVPGGRGDGDAAWPNGLVFDGNHNLYGLAYSGGHCTTDETGTDCNGAAFRLKKSSQRGWSEKVIYRFRGVTGAPAGPVLDTAGNLSRHGTRRRVRVRHGLSIAAAFRRTWRLERIILVRFSGRQRRRISASRPDFRRVGEFVQRESRNGLRLQQRIRIVA